MVGAKEMETGRCEATKSENVKENKRKKKTPKRQRRDSVSKRERKKLKFPVEKKASNSLASTWQLLCRDPTSSPLLNV